MAQQCPQGQRWDEWKGTCVPMAGDLQTPDKGLGGGQPDLGAGGDGDSGYSGGGIMNCPEGYRWSLKEKKCIPKEGIWLPKDERCPPGEHWEGGFFGGIGGKCVPDDKYRDDELDAGDEQCVADGGTWDYGSHTCNYDSPENLSPEERGWHQWCINNGYGGYDKESQTCLPANCPQGQKWDSVMNKCIPICPEGTHWDAVQATCVEGEGPTVGQPESNLPSDFYEQTIDPNADVLPDQPGDVFGQKYPQISRIIGGDPNAEAQAEERYWQTKMTRLEEQYQKRQEQLEADLNVSGLYYSGVKADKLQELNREYMQDVAEEEAKFQYERYEREMQRNKQAMDSILGMESLNIQYAISNGTLSLDQLQLALQEKLGMGAQDIAQQGIDVEVMSLLTQQSMAAAQTDIERQKIWQNTVMLLYEMGLSEEEVQAMWAQIAGQNRQPPY